MNTVNSGDKFTQVHRDYARWVIRRERRRGTPIDVALANQYRVWADAAVMQAKRLGLENPERTALFELCVAETIEAELKEAAA